MSWRTRDKKRRRRCKHHRYIFVRRVALGDNEYYEFVCKNGAHFAKFEIHCWWYGRKS